MLKQRSSGILLHPTSLPGKYGIGTLGRDACNFIDFLSKSGQSLWQILPLGPTGFADSPYQCFSSLAGNPLLIDLEQLVTDGLLQSGDLLTSELHAEGYVDYETLIPVKNLLLKKAYESFAETKSAKEKKGFLNFTQSQSSWLDDFALFMALKDHFQNEAWYTWENPLKLRELSALKKYKDLLSKEIGYHKFQQYTFFRQWSVIKDYANLHNVRIIGDIPLYVAYDSADVWVNPGLFQLDKNLTPVAVGGVPPDYFSETGQLWGNPLYDWDALRKDGFKWWVDRIRKNLALYDIIRIDHFRGFAGYWAIPYGEDTAVNGKWMSCPGTEFFEVLGHTLGELSIIAEDLGVITPEVMELRDSNGLPGMKILQFAFDSKEENDHLPYNYSRNCVVYTGTHDNDTVSGWFESASAADREFFLEYIQSDGTSVNWDMIRVAWGSVANTAIVPMQDLLGLGNAARMNLPGTTSGNWKWRATKNNFDVDLANRLAHITNLYGRNTKQESSFRKKTKK